MKPVDSLVIGSEVWPAAEIERIIAAECSEHAGLSYAGEVESHRGVDPGVVAAVVSGLFGIAAPFVAGLANRFLNADPKVELTLVNDEGSTVKLYAKLSEAERKALIERAMEAGAARVVIGERPSRS